MATASKTFPASTRFLPAKHSRRGWRFAGVRILLRGLSIILFLALWQLASIHHLRWPIDFTNVPSPSEAALALLNLLHAPKIAKDAWFSIVRVLAGFGAAAALGIVLGLIIGVSKFAEDMILTPLEVLRPIPAVAWVPLATLMFASAESSMIYITFIGAFFPILVSTIHGVERVDKRLITAALCLGAGKTAIFREVILPGALPFIFTGLSIGMGTSWFSLVTAEMISGQFGIGYYTWESYNLQKYPEIVVGMVSIGLLGMGSSALIRTVGRHMTPWTQISGEHK
jgi:NitT/TauT family transport system permease protein